MHLKKIVETFHPLKTKKNPTRKQKSVFKCSISFLILRFSSFFKLSKPHLSAKPKEGFRFFGQPYVKYLFILNTTLKSAQLRSMSRHFATVLSSVHQPTLAVKCQVSCWFLLVSHSDSSPSLECISHVSIGLSAISACLLQSIMSTL